LASALGLALNLTQFLVEKRIAPRPVDRVIGLRKEERQAVGEEHLDRFFPRRVIIVGTDAHGLPFLIHDETDYIPWVRDDDSKAPIVPLAYGEEKREGVIQGG
jgi:hypothetical protein